MSLIKTIEIAGFRGILTPVTLKFQKASGCESMVIHGRNGHGKSSITDSWEWFHTGLIGRLNREDAKHASFPHRQAVATGAPSYVSVELKDGTVLKQTFNFNKVTKPSVSGDVDGFRRNVPHPCQLRYDDLARFVCKTKNEQYESLAKFMGFEAQVEFQKSLGRIHRQFKDEVDRQSAVWASCRADVISAIGSNDATESQVIALAESLLSHHGVAAIKSIADIREALIALDARIKADPTAQELAALGTLKRATAAVVAPPFPGVGLTRHAAEVARFKKREGQAIDLLLIELYEKGKAVIESRVEKELPIKTCPLCDRPYDGDLLQHIEAELDEFRELQVERNTLEKARKALVNNLGVKKSLADSFAAAVKGIESATEQMDTGPIESATELLDEALDTARSLLRDNVEKSPADFESSCGLIAAEIDDRVRELEEVQKELLQRVDARMVALQDDGQRERLINDNRTLESLLKSWDRWDTEKAKLKRMRKTLQDLGAIVDDFVAASNADVSRRFDTISGDVARYFSILEVNAKTLSSPALRLIADQERSVTLEIEFRGEKISPAYKYLSESQLNSFGLALFLASARQFNGNFKFLILDDVVNSFDAHKRPQVVQLLKSEFHDFQLLILTHDEIWSERLFRAFPKWARIRFTQYDPNTGPIMGDGLSDLEKVEKLLLAGEATQAGQLLGQVMERELQELCEQCEATLTYNRRNEYTLQPLFVAFHSRMKSKLKEAHAVCAALKDLEDDLGYRNLCAHWKNPTSPLTVEEMEVVVEKWKKVIGLVRCTDAKCGEYVKYDTDKQDFICLCRKLVVSKAPAATAGTPTQVASVGGTN